MNRFLIYAAIAAPMLAQEHIPIPLADANRPVTMSIHLLRGNVTVRAYNGHEVIVDSKANSPEKPDKKESTHEGMHRIAGGMSDLSIESENNKVTISDRSGRGADVTIQTPVNTSLNVHSISGGQITIEGVNGDVDAQNMSGAVTIRNVSGSVVAHSLNGSVTVTMASVKSGSPMSFTSLNGTIDVTLPANLAADLSMKTTHGEIYSDFDVKLKPATKPVVEESGTKKGKYKVKTEGSVGGTINGGGPEFKFQTLNGNIYIRKPK
jgi:DUF4097 and DUF4098 domain-containing protein YvlB